MYCKFSTGLRNKLANNIGFYEAFTNGVIYLYDGAPPASPDAAITGTLLGKITLASGAFVFGTSTNGINFDSSAVAGVISKASGETWSGVGLAAGTAGWARFMGNASDNLGVSTTLARMDVDVANAGASWNMANTLIAIGTPIVVAQFDVVMPGA